MFVLYDKTRKGFVTGYLTKDQLHGIAKSAIHAKPFQSKKSAKEFVGQIPGNIKNLTDKESYKQEILDYSDECFAICSRSKK